MSDWKYLYEKYGHYDSPKHRRILETESRTILDWLLILRLPEYNILEVGCGSGYLGALIANNLWDRKISFTYHMTDIVPEAVEMASKRLSAFPDPSAIRFSLQDVYKLNNAKHDIIISTGFASAASYKDAVPIVSNSLKAGGILICDFINHLSPWLFLLHIPRSLQRLHTYKQDALNPDSKYYHFGAHGIREYFHYHNLEILELVPIGRARNSLLGMFRKA